MRRGRAIFAMAIAVGVSGCSTHEPRFEEDVAAPARPTAREIRLLTLASEQSLHRFGSRASRLTTEALAAFARSAAIGYLAQRDRAGQGVDHLRRTALVLGDALAARAIAMPDGRGYGAGPGGLPDPRVTSEAGNALLDVFLATGQARYAKGVSAAVRSIVSPANHWPTGSGRPEFGVLAGAPRFAVRSPRIRDRYDVPATATVAVFLERAASVDISSSSTGIAPDKPVRAELVRQRSLSGMAAGFVADQFPSTYSQRYLGAGTPIDLGALARIVAVANGAANHELKQLALNQGPVVKARVFLPNGQPRLEGLGLTSALALNGLDLTSSTARRLLLWTTRHKRRDGTARVAAASDALAQGYVTLALARTLHMVERGVFPQP